MLIYTNSNFEPRITELNEAYFLFSFKKWDENSTTMHITISDS